nr:DUF1905 domain-containing protein [Kineosporia babensis]
MIEWRGPAPFHFLRVPEELCDDLRELAKDVTYGWGMVPVSVRIGTSTWETSLWPKDGGYLLPVKDRVRRHEQLELGDVVRLGLRVISRGGRLVDGKSLG